MASDEKKLKGILDKNQKYLDGIHEGIVEGTEEGIKKGTTKGVKRAAWDVLKEECLPQGFMNISASDIEDIVRNLWALTKNIDGEITKAANKIIERNIKQYRDRLVVDIIKKFRGQKPELAFVLELVTQRENKVGELISERLPNNPISSGIVKGVQTALRTGIDRSTQGFRNELKDKLEGVDNITGESQNTKTAQRVEKIKDDSKSITRDAVAKVVEEIVYRLLKMMHKRVLARLRKELGEKLIHKLEQKIGEITKQKMEQLFEKSTERLIEEIGKDCIKEKSFVENIDKTFGNSAKESLKSLTKWLTPLKAIAITSVILASVGGGVFAGQNLPPTSPTTTSPTITSPTITSPTTTSPTITSPTITSPTITSPTITSPTITSPTIVTFPDPNLEAAVREAINKLVGPIYVSDLESLTVLEAPEQDILDLTGLESCQNLERLDLAYNNISDISTLAGLTNLQVLDLTNNNISDISALADLTNLWNLLDLTNNNISDISALTNLTNLQMLRIRGNNISDISALASLTNLWLLNAGTNNISDISALAGLANLHTLLLDGNNISDLSPLAGLTNLEWLNVGINNISDISALADLANLDYISLSGNNISDISALAGLTNLQQLYLDSNNISDISALAGLTNLQQLYLDSNNISDIFPLVENIGLADGDTVYLTGNPLSGNSEDLGIGTLEERGVTVYY